MLISRLQSTLFLATVAVGGLLAFGCSTGDVGAPCNHGQITAPPGRIVTFPALSCSDLLCVYGEERTVPEVDCATDADCNDAAGETDEVFDCVENSCALSLDYVLERSMCSRRCSSNDDCNNTSVGNRPAVNDDETSCQSGFSCTVIQSLGPFCCQRLCVCNDDLTGDNNELEQSCEPGGEVFEDCFGGDQDMSTPDEAGS